MAEQIAIRPPTRADGAAMWRLAGRAGGLDVNSSYAYLLWCRDFAATTVVAVDPGSDELAGFVSGYRRPDEQSVLLVWQVAVDPGHRRIGLGSRMLDAIVGVLRDLGGSHIETTVTPGNEASRAMFGALANRHGTGLSESELFGADDFPDDHEPELLLRIGPFV